MIETKNDSHVELRRMAYVLLIVVGTGLMLGRILAVDSVDKVGLEREALKAVPAKLAERRQKLEAAGLAGDALQQELNRIEAKLLEKAHLRRPFLCANDRSRWCTVRALVEEDMRVPDTPYAIDKVVQLQNWDTIDMVKHDDHLYSSKPPLLATIIAAVYWPIHYATGATLGTHPYEIGRTLLIIFNVLPLIVYFVLLSRLIERFGTTDWGRLFAMAAAVFGTFLTTFAVTINNHIPAAVCAVAAIYATVRIWFDEERRLRYFVAAGLFGSLAAVNEFPATSLFALLTLVVLMKAPRQALVGFVPAVAIVAVAFFATNYIAHKSLVPAYLHRSGDDNWYDYSYQREGRTIESYWRHPVGVDQGEPSHGLYAFQVLLGHHGVFSLTPIWLLSFCGLGIWMVRRCDPRLRWTAWGIAVMSLACLVFYIGQPQMNRNYGGVTSGLRWMFWFAPLWLLAMLPTVDGMANRRWMRGLALFLLAFSVLSASYPTWNPWTPPWLMDFMQYLGVL